MEILYRTQREEKGEALEPIFLFPLVGQHLLDNDGIRTARTHAALEHCARFCGWLQETSSPAPLDVQREQRKTWGTQTSLEGMNLSLGFLSFLVGTILGV